jgi:glutamyl-tRNA reductase
VEIVVIGLNHHLAPVDVRASLAPLANSLPESLAALAEKSRLCDCSVLESVIICTCNRVEIYSVVSDCASGFDELSSFLGGKCEVPGQELEGYLYRYEGPAAVNHLFSVAAGLDSMVVGENEILGQVREAYHLATEERAANSILSELFRRAISAGKRARTETAISRNAASVSSVAVELARKAFDDLSACQALVIGTGEMGKQSLRNLVVSGVRRVMVSNRTRQTAVPLAEEFNGQVIDFQDIPLALGEADIVISSTASPRPIIHTPQVKEAMQTRPDRPLFIIDIAMPPDVEPEVRQVEGVFLYTMDDLQLVLEANLAKRREEIPKVQAIVAEEARKFLTWYQVLDVVPTIVDLRRYADDICQAELQKAMRRLGSLDEREREIVKALAVGVVNKLVHGPIVCLKERAQEQRAYQYTEILRELFNLNGCKG